MLMWCEPSHRSAITGIHRVSMLSTLIMLHLPSPQTDDRINRRASHSWSDVWSQFLIILSRFLHLFLHWLSLKHCNISPRAPIVSATTALQEALFQENKIISKMMHAQKDRMWFEKKTHKKIDHLHNLKSSCLIQKKSAACVFQNDP